MVEIEEATLIKVIGIVGSLSAGSYTRMAVKIALQGAAELGIETELVDLRDFNLPFCDGTKNQSEEVVRFRQLVDEAHGIIIGTPDYHGSYSGVLKNALDHLGADEFRGKLIGLVSVGGGALGGSNALNELRSISRTLHAWVVPQQAAVASAWQAFDENGNLKDKNLDSRVKEVGRQVVRFSSLHNSDASRELLSL